MKRSQLYSILFAIVVVSGCAVPNMQTQNLVPLSSDKFPSYRTTPITEGVRVGAPVGSFKERVTVTGLLTTGSKTERRSGSGNIEYLIRVQQMENNATEQNVQIITRAQLSGEAAKTEVTKVKSILESNGRLADATVSSTSWEDIESREVKFRLRDGARWYASFRSEGIREELRTYFEVKGGSCEIEPEKLFVLVREKGNEISARELKVFDNIASAAPKDGATGEYAKGGWLQFLPRREPVKSGDVLSRASLSALMSEIPELETGVDSMSEVVEGWGVYKNKRVLVTRTDFDVKIDLPQGEAQFRIGVRGYSLYDSQTFVPLSSRAVGTFSGRDSKGEEGSVRFELLTEAYDINVTNVVYSPQVQSSPSNTHPKKSDWNEASGKIKALGELLTKGLITQEEYDKKKAVLLEDF
jgi:hypothetical protein